MALRAVDTVCSLGGHDKESLILKEYNCYVYLLPTGDT